MKIITVATHKGGQGKSTTAKNLGWTASKHGKTLLIDLDPQANLTRWLGVATQDVNIADLFRDKSIIETAINIRPNIDVIPGSLKMAKINIELISRPRKEEILMKRLREVKDMYDYVIIDTPPALDNFVANAVLAANIIIIPVRPESGSTEGIRQLVEFSREVIDGEPNIRFALTKVDGSEKVMINYTLNELKSLGFTDLVLKKAKLSDTGNSINDYFYIQKESAVDHSNSSGEFLEEFNQTAKNIYNYQILFEEILKYV